MVIVPNCFAGAIEIVEKLRHREFQVSITDLIMKILPNKKLIFENSGNVLFDLIIAKIHSFGYEVYDGLFVDSHDLVVWRILQLLEELFRVEDIESWRLLIFIVRGFFSFT